MRRGNLHVHLVDENVPTVGVFEAIEQLPEYAKRRGHDAAHRTAVLPLGQHFDRYFDVEDTSQ